MLTLEGEGDGGVEAGMEVTQVKSNDKLCILVNNHVKIGFESSVKF